MNKTKKCFYKKFSDKKFSVSFTTIDYNRNNMLLNYKTFVESYKWKPSEGEHDDVLYHITDKNNIKNFRPFTHFGTANAARARAYEKTTNLFDRGELPSNTNLSRRNFHHYSVRLKLGNTVDIKDDFSHDPWGLVHQLHKAGHLNDEDRQVLNNKINKSQKNSNDYVKGFKILANYLNRKGIDTISYTNKVEDRGNKSYMITNHKQVRVLRKNRSLINLDRGQQHWTDWTNWR